MLLRHWTLATCGVALVAALTHCGGDDAPTRPPKPTLVPDATAGPRLVKLTADEGAALFSVSGTSEKDVWAVGADKGKGPLALHFDGAVWSRVPTGHRGDLWWIHALPDGTAYAAGSEGAVLRFDGKAFTRIPTPGLGKHTVFGVWVGVNGDVWAAGGAAGREGFLWKRTGDGMFVDVRLPALPARADGERPALLKVWGDDRGTIWAVGDRGTLLRGTAGGDFAVVPTGTTERLFTVSGHGDLVVAVGGTGGGIILETGPSGAVRSAAPPLTPLLQGVSVGPTGDAYAVGERGTILRRSAGGWLPVQNELGLRFESIHGAYRDAQGGLWAVGGNVLSPKLDAGAFLYFGQRQIPAIPAEALTPEVAPSCPDSAVDPAPTASIARRWNEQIMGAIRRDVPRPGVHARNLFHLSAAVWDAWTAFEPAQQGFLSTEKLTATDREASRAEAISFAAYRILRQRYEKAIGGRTSVACLDAFMKKLAYDATNVGDEGSTGRALGNRIAKSYLTSFAEDGANEAKNYADTTGWKADNEPLVVDDTKPSVTRLGRWQPLNLSVAATQNGIVLPGGTQGYICPQWGNVTPFALVRAPGSPVFEDPGAGPSDDPDEFRPDAVDVLRKESLLDPSLAETMDASPASQGNNPLGTNDGRGYPLNPTTGKPYAPHIVKVADFGRVLAEHWADGPQSETPPGHWNVIANHLADDPRLQRRLFGVGPELDALAWDVHIYLAMNGALHDAAIAAWELKRRDVTARPITLIRAMGYAGQSTDPALPSYAKGGLPLVPGLIELITKESIASGRHARLAAFENQIAVRGWRGEPGDRRRDIGGVDWIRAVEWLPYQRRTFVTPAFPGYVSGHSTFSRAAAEVLSAVTGSPYFPGGYAFFEAKEGYLTFERGPSQPVRLEWATYFDAADQAGQSRLWGGIHITPDDFQGRELGRRVGVKAIEKARTIFSLPPR